MSKKSMKDAYAAMQVAFGDTMVENPPKKRTSKQKKLKTSEELQKLTLQELHTLLKENEKTIKEVEAPFWKSGGKSLSKNEVKSIGQKALPYRTENIIIKRILELGNYARYRGVVL